MLTSYADIYSVAELVENAEDCVYPPMLKGKLWRALDALRAGNAPADDLRKAEEVALHVHEITLSMGLPKQEREVRIAAIKTEIAAIAHEWLLKLPIEVSRKVAAG